MTGPVHRLHRDRLRVVEQVPQQTARTRTEDRWSWGKAIGFMVIVSGAVWLGLLAVLIV